MKILLLATWMSPMTDRGGRKLTARWSWPATSICDWSRLRLRDRCRMTWCVVRSTVLGSADGLGTSELARRHQVSRPTMSLWRKRWREGGLVGLRTELRPRRPRTIDDERAAELVSTALHGKPAGQMHWSVRSASWNRICRRSSPRGRRCHVCR